MERHLEKLGPDIRRIFASPDLYFWRYNETEALFVDMDRDAYQRSIFFDDRISPTSRVITKIKLSRLYEASEAQKASPPKISYIFHMAHGGSTLLARALDVKARNIVYREPATLRQLGATAAEARHGANPPQSWQRLLHLTTTLLGKSYKKDRPVIIKANVPVNFIIPELMDIHPRTRGILLYATLDNYLLSVLKHPDWVIHVLAELGNSIDAVSGINVKERDKLTPAQAAACLWLVQISLYEKLVKQYSNIRTLNAEILFNNPKLVISNACKFFGSKLNAARIHSIVNSDLFSHHSKIPGQRYDNDRRIREKERLKGEIATALTEARDWIETHSEACPIPATLRKSLTNDSSVLM